MNRSRKAKKVLFRNRNQTGWWIASFIERFEYYDEDRSNPNRRCLAWENTILIKASDRDEAYKKAVSKGRESDGNECWEGKTGRKGSWHFEGLTDLLPVYDDLDDGAEILWVEHAGKSVRKIKSYVRKKRELSVFDNRTER